MPLVSWCWLLVLSLLLCGLIEDYHYSSVVSMKSYLGIVVSAFQLKHSFRQTRQHLELYKNEGFSPLVRPSVKMPRRFFSNKDINTSSISNLSYYTEYRHHLHYRNLHRPLFSGSSSDNEGGTPGDNESGGENNKKPSMKRIGGRKSRQKPPENDSSVVNVEGTSKKNHFPSGGSLVAALLVLTLLKNLFFGGASDSESYYYYSYSSSSVYESRLNPDGSRSTTETTRQESSDLKTNIPGLTEQDFLDRRSTNRGGSTYFYFED